MKKKRPYALMLEDGRIDIRALKRLGAVVPGAKTQYRDGKRCFTVDLRPDHPHELELVEAGRTHIIRLRMKPAPLGGVRTYLLDERLKRCEILYLSGGRYVSRRKAGLTYASQNLNPWDRLAMRREGIEKKLAEKTFRGVKGREEKAVLLGQKAEIFEKLDRRGLATAKARLDRDQNALVRQYSARKRLRLAQEHLVSKPTMPSNHVLATYKGHLDTLIAGRKIPENLPQIMGESSAQKLVIDAPVIDVVDYQTLGHVVAGKLTALELGWPEHFIGKRRIFLVFDLRRVGKACVAIVIKSGRKLHSELFWIATNTTKFGKAELRFVDKTGCRGRQLIFDDGAFVLEPSRTANLETGPSEERIEHLRIRIARHVQASSPLREYEQHLQREEDRQRRLNYPVTPYVPSFLERRYGDLIEQAKLRTPWPRGPRRLVTPTNPVPERAVFDIQLVQKFGYVRDGELSGGEIAWPTEWIGDATTGLMFFVDLRPPQACIAFVLADRHRDPKVQILWLDCEVLPLRALLLRDPKTGDVSRYAYFRRGRMILPGGRSRHDSSTPPITLQERCLLSEKKGGAGRKLCAPATRISVDSMQSASERDELVQRYLSETNPLVSKVRRTLGPNHSLSAYAPDDIVLSATTLRTHWAYDPAPLSAGMLNIPDMQGRFLIDMRGEPSVSLFVGPDDRRTTFPITTVLSQSDWHFVEPRSGAISAHLLLQDGGFGFPNSGIGNRPL